MMYNYLVYMLYRIIQVLFIVYMLYRSIIVWMSHIHCTEFIYFLFFFFLTLGVNMSRSIIVLISHAHFCRIYFLRVPHLNEEAEYKRAALCE